jgi:serine/threonine-protein kinase
MAEIHLAKRVDVGGFERLVVIKRALPHVAAHAELRTALLDEARIMACLRHPNVVAVHELGDDGGNLYLVMEHLRGESLAGLVRELRAMGEGLDRAIAVHVALEMCAGLHAAHELRDEDGRALHVVHRDVSPQNVFLTFDGEVKLLDFGIARFDDRAAAGTKAGVTKGKFAYMAPEQFAGALVDRRADVFAIGVVLHELLTGRRLFARDTEMEVLKAILQDPIPSPSEVAPDANIPAELDRACMRALARDPGERFPSAEAMHAALHALMPQIDPSHEARARLVRTLQRALPERLAEDRELLRRAREDGRPATQEMLRPRLVRTWDVETQPEISSVQPSPAPVSNDVRAPDEITAAGRPSRKLLRAAGRSDYRWAGSLAGAAAIAALGAAGFAFAGSPPAPPRVAAEAVEPPPRRSIQLYVESDPPGALVRVDGRAAGTTPCHLALERAASPVELSIAVEGLAEVRDRIVPDLDQRVLIVLAPGAGRPTKRAR